MCDVADCRRIASKIKEKYAVVRIPEGKSIDDLLGGKTALEAIASIQMMIKECGEPEVDYATALHIANVCYHGHELQDWALRPILSDIESLPASSLPLSGKRLATSILRS